jgi:F1F0 ATPase subunit 2
MVSWLSVVERLAIALVIGVGLGFFYFGGLWFTVQKVTQVKRPFLWLWSSFLIRFFCSCLLFYFLIGFEGDKLLSALGGFFLIRLILINQAKQ